MTRAGSVLVIAVAAVGAGCMGQRAARAPSATPAQAQGRPPYEAHEAGMMMPCPMAVPGTQVAAADTPDGEALTFTTSPEGVPDLRARVHAMADMHNHGHEGGHMGMHEGMHPGMGRAGSARSSAGGSPEPTMPMAMPPPSRAVVEDVEGGARVTVTPNDPADLEQLRMAVRAHADHMRQTGTCGMGHAPPQR